MTHSSRVQFTVTMVKKLMKHELITKNIVCIYVEMEEFE